MTRDGLLTLARIVRESHEACQGAHLRSNVLKLRGVGKLFVNIKCVDPECQAITTC
jgi:hypothetical protein